MVISQMGDYPLNPNAIVLLLELKLLKAFCIEVANFLIFENLLCFLNVRLTLIYDISCLIDLAEKLFCDSSDSSSTVNYSVSLILWVLFEIVHQKFEGKGYIESA